MSFTEDDGSVRVYGTYTAYNGFHIVPQLLEAYERGHWDDVARLAHSLGVREEDVSKGYLNALRWAEEVLSQTA